MAKKIHQNDIKGHNHKQYGKKGFICSKCILWIDGGEDDLDSYMMCSKLIKRDYKFNDGGCPYSYNKYKIINKKIILNQQR